MAIAFVGAAALGNNGGTTNSYTAAYSRGADTNGFLVIGIFGDNITGGADDITSVTYNGVSATLIAKANNTTSGAGGRFTYAYALPLGNTAAGSHNVVVNAATSHYIGVVVSEYQGVSQSLPVDHSQVTYQPVGPASAAITITSIADNCWDLAYAWVVTGTTAATPGVGTVLRVEDTFGISGIFDNNAAIHPAGNNTLNINYPASPLATPAYFIQFTLAPAADNLAPALYPDPDNVYAPVIGGGVVTPSTGIIIRRTALGKTRRLVLAGAGPGAGNLAPALYPDPDNIYAPVIGGGVVTPSTGVIIRRVALGKTRRLVLGGAAAGNLAPALYPDPDTVYAPVIGGGVANLAPGLYPDPDTVFAPAIGLGLVNLAPGLYPDPDNVFAPVVVVGPGPLGLAPGLYPDPDNVYAPVVSGGVVNLAPGLYPDPDNVFAPAIGRGLVNLAPGLYPDPDNVFAPVVAVGPGALVLAPGLYSDPDTVFAPAIGLGSVNLAPALYPDPDNVFGPIIQRAGDPPNVQGWYPPSITNPLPVYFVTRRAGPTRAGIEDAPQDSRVYGRCNGRWVAIDVQPD
jgi:hypothetical protein